MALVQASMTMIEITLSIHAYASCCERYRNLGTFYPSTA